MWKSSQYLRGGRPLHSAWSGACPEAASADERQGAVVPRAGATWRASQAGEVWRRLTLLCGQWKTGV